MSFYKFVFWMPLLGLCGCSGSPPQTEATNTTQSAQSDPGASVVANGSDSNAAPQLDCSGTDTAASANAVMGVQLGMTPNEAVRQLQCRGYNVIFPNESTRRNVEREQERGMFRFDFQHPEKREFIRLFADGTPNDQQIYYIGREVTFGKEAPTLEGVAKQFIDTYNPGAPLYYNHLGNIESANGTVAAEPVKMSAQEAARHCRALVITGQYELNQPTPERAASREQNCEAMIGMQVIKSGLNEKLAYVARYRMLNPLLGYTLMQQRISQAEAQEAARIEQEASEAEDPESLPDL